MFHTLVLDLDNTIYPESSGVLAAIGDRICLYIQSVMGFSDKETRKIRNLCRQHYGTTLQGLYDLYGINQDEYLAFVHDIDLKKYLNPNDRLAEILDAYSQKKVIFSNADRNHIIRVLDFFQITHHFDMIIDVHHLAPFVKPQSQSFEKCLKLMGLSSWEGCVFIDDYRPNIQAACEQGIFCVHVDESMETDFKIKISSLTNLPIILPTTIN